VTDAATVRPARADEYDDVMAVLEGALLEVDPGAVRSAVDADEALVAVDDGRVVGAAVLEPADAGAHLSAVAVRPARRGQGVGRALVAAAARRHGRLTAAFRPDVRGFYEACGFRVREEGERCRGVLADGGEGE
jgi:GNAT superfamily N-acetyltransferase